MSHFASILLCFSAAAALQTQSPKDTTPDPPCQSKQHGIHFPQPEQYPVTPQPHLHPHAPILRTHTDHLYRTTIREAAAEGVNFAGHYAVAKWGCGTGCVGFVIVDLRTGKVFDPSTEDIGYHYPSSDAAPLWTCFDDILVYSKTSRLFVIEGCMNENTKCGRHFYEMAANGLHLISFDPDLQSDGRKVAP